jgi:hypothetical protein
MLIGIVLLVLLAGCTCAHGNEGDFFPECTSVIYDLWNRVDVEKMIYNCSSNIQGALFPPSYFDASSGKPFTPTIVNISVAFNSMVKIDDIEGELSLDYWFQMFWYDPRWKFPTEMWASMSPETLVEGIELTQYVRTQGTPLNIWLPDTYALEAISVTTQAEQLHLSPDGSVWWSRHIFADMKQGQMSLKDYPMDSQQFIINFESYGYDTRFIELKPFTAMNSVTFNLDPHSKREFIAVNPLWEFKSSQHGVTNHGSPIFFDQKRSYSSFSIFLNFKRDSFGIVFRLALPVLMFLFLVGFAFWAELDKRVDVTITMLLAVSALYLIIGSIIPFVGYFSILDKFVTTAFCILSLTAGVHYMVCYLDAEKGRYPLNELWMILIVYFCRICWAPFIFLFGVIYYFPELIYGVLGPVVVILLVTTGATLWNLQDIEVTFRKCVCHMKVKHFYEEMNIPYLHTDDKEGEEPTDQLVISALTLGERVFFYYVITRNISCACEMTERRTNMSSKSIWTPSFFMNFFWKKLPKNEIPVTGKQQQVVPDDQMYKDLQQDLEKPLERDITGIHRNNSSYHVRSNENNKETTCKLLNFAVGVGANYLGQAPSQYNKCNNRWCPKCTSVHSPDRAAELVSTRLSSKEKSTRLNL